jgi:hypothetical protein
MSFIQSIIPVQWQQNNPGTDCLSGGGGYYYQQTDLTVNSLLATNNVLLVGAYFNNTVSDYYFTMVNVSDISGISGGGGGSSGTSGGGGGSYGSYGNYGSYGSYGVYFNIPWNGVGNYPAVSVTSSPTLEYVYINYPDTYEANQTAKSNTSITSLTFDPLTGNYGTNNASIDLCGNPICFNTICINNTIDSQAFMSYAIGGESSTANQSNIYFCSSLPFSTTLTKNAPGMLIQSNGQSTGIYNLNLASSSWQNITNYVVNCETSISFTYFITSPTLDNSDYPNFTSITTTENGTVIVVSANDDIYGGIYCLQNNGGDEFTPNTQSSRSGNWQMNGVIGIKFQLPSTYSTNWTTTTFQSISSSTLQKLNGGFQNYIIGIQDNTTLLKIAFNVPTSYNSNLICDCSYTSPTIIDPWDPSNNDFQIVGPLVSLVSNLDAQNVVVFITQTQFFVSNDTGNNFYYIDLSFVSSDIGVYYSSVAITSSSTSSGSSTDSSGNNSTDYQVSIFLGTTNGSVYQLVTDLSGNIPPPTMSQREQRFLKGLTHFILQYRKTMQTIESSDYITDNPNTWRWLLIGPIVINILHLYALKRTFRAIISLICECFVWMDSKLLKLTGGAFSFGKSFAIISKYINLLVKPIGEGITKLGSYLFEMLKMLGKLIGLSYDVTEVADPFLEDTSRDAFDLGKGGDKDGIDSLKGRDGDTNREGFDEDSKPQEDLIHLMTKNAIYIAKVWGGIMVFTVPMQIAWHTEYNEMNEDLGLFPGKADTGTFRFKADVEVYDIKYIKQLFNTASTAIEAYNQSLQEKLSNNEINSGNPNAEREYQAIKYIQMINTTILLLLIIFLMFTNKFLYISNAWKKMRGEPVNKVTKQEVHEELYGLLMENLDIIVAVWTVLYLICAILFYTANLETTWYLGAIINELNSDDPHYIQVHWETFFTDLAFEYQEIWKGISDFFELIFHSIFGHNSRIQTAKANLQTDIQNRQSGGYTGGGGGYYSSSPNG